MKDAFDPGTGELLEETRPPSGEVEPAREQSVQALYLDAFGRELPNPTPLQPPIGYKRSPSIAETVRAAIRQASMEAHMAGAETEEEANDFDVDEDMDPASPWEHDFEMDPALEMMLARSSKPPEKEGGQEAKLPASPPSEEQSAPKAPSPAK